MTKRTQLTDGTEVTIEIKRPRRVTDAHRRDLLHLLGFGALPFRAICTKYAGESTGPVDHDLVRRTLDSLIGRGEVVPIRTRRLPQHAHSSRRKPGKAKKERAPMTVYALTGPIIGLGDWARTPPRRVALEDHLLALLCVAADAGDVGRTTLVCSTDAQAQRVMAEAKRLLSVESWARS